MLRLQEINDGGMCFSIGIPGDVRVRSFDGGKSWIASNCYQHEATAQSFPTFMLAVGYAEKLVTGPLKRDDRLGIPLDTLIRRYPHLLTAGEREAEAEGEAAFRSISGRLADAMRGTKSYPDSPRCPYRRPERVAAWMRGFDRLDMAFSAA